MRYEDLQTFTDRNITRYEPLHNIAYYGGLFGYANVLGEKLGENFPEKISKYVNKHNKTTVNYIKIKYPKTKVRLKGRMFSVDKAASERTLILLPGSGLTAWVQFERFLNMLILAEKGVSPVRKVVLADWRSYGDSYYPQFDCYLKQTHDFKISDSITDILKKNWYRPDGSYTVTPSSLLSDAHAVYQNTLKHVEKNPANIIVYGYSMGGYAAVKLIDHLIKEEKAVPAGLALHSPIRTVAAAAIANSSHVGVTKFLGNLTDKLFSSCCENVEKQHQHEQRMPLLGGAIDTETCLKNVITNKTGFPVLFVHGGEKDFPGYDTQHLYNAVKNANTKIVAYKANHFENHKVFKDNYCKSVLTTFFKTSQIINKIEGYHF